MSVPSPSQESTGRGDYQRPSQPLARWQIEAQLERLGYAYLKKTLQDPERREELFHRARRGLISYEKRPIAELRKFCLQRKLDPPPAKGASKQELISLLWDADDLASFDQFTELPPELRIRVYEYVCQDPYLQMPYGESPPSYRNYAIHRQPAITRTNRLLRKEALPVFYDNVSAHMFANKENPKFPCSVLLRAPDSVVSQWRKITMLALAISVGPSDHGMFGHWSIELPGKGKAAQISYTKSRNKRLENTLLKEEVESAIRKVLQRMDVRDGMAKMRRADLEELGKVVQRARTSLRSREGLV